MKDLYLVGSSNNWEKRQQYHFKGHEGNLSSLLVDLPAGTHQFLIATDETATHRLGAEGSEAEIALNQLIVLKEGEVHFSLSLDQSGIYFFSIDASQDSPVLRILTKYKRSVEDKTTAHGVGLDHFLKMKLPVSFEVGRTSLQISEALSLGQGSLLELDRNVGEDLHVYVGGRLVAVGEVVVVNQHFGVRILEVVSPEGALLETISSSHAAKEPVNTGPVLSPNEEASLLKGLGKKKADKNEVEKPE